MNALFLLKLIAATNQVKLFRSLSDLIPTIDEINGMIRFIATSSLMMIGSVCFVLDYFESFFCFHVFMLLAALAFIYLWFVL